MIENCISGQQEHFTEFASQNFLLLFEFEIFQDIKIYRDITSLFFKI